MTVSNTLRFLLKKFSSGGDPHPTREEHNEMIDAIENNAAMGAQGITSARPAAGKGRRFFWDETAQRMHYDDGTAWKDLNPNGGGGAGSAIVPGAAASEGASARAARADHTHSLPLATGAAHGALSSTDKAKLDNATAGATGNTLALRDVNGRISTNTPTLAGHVTTKAYTDDLHVQAANYVDTQVGANGLTVRSWTLGTATGFTVTGRIESVPLVNKTHVTGTVTIIRPNGSAAYPVAGGGNTLPAWLGNIIPAELRDVAWPDIDGMTMLRGGAAYAALQTVVQPSSGRIGVRSLDTGGASWGPNAQMAVSFSYYVQTVVA